MYITTPTHIWAWQQAIMIELYATVAARPTLNVRILLISAVSYLTDAIYTTLWPKLLARSRFGTLPRLFSACTYTMWVKTVKRACN